jgi:excisionase family DNA binding protein
MSLSLPADVKPLSWAAEQLGIGVSTAYRLVGTGQIPGAFRVGGQWRVSVPRFFSVVHGTPAAEPGADSTSPIRQESGQDCSPAPGRDALERGRRPEG